MPSATTMKSEKNGTKRKAESGKDGKVKKTKVDISAEKPKHEKKVHIKAPKVKKVIAPPPPEESSDDDSPDAMSDDGGVTLGEDDSEESEEAVPKIQDGVHPDRVKATANGGGPNGTTSREAHAKQKQLVLERRNAKPLADQLARTKKLWETLRRKSHVPLAERKVLIAELFDIITGKMKDFVLKHDSVRVVQTAIKYGNAEQKRQIARELKGTYRQLAESRYAKFLIGKLLVQGDDEIRDIIVPEFFGHVRRLIKHPEASWILDDVYRGVANRQQKATILREWYGAEFAIFQAEGKVTGDLKDILEEQPGKRAPIMKSLQELINHLIQKKMTGFTLLHDAMYQYFLNAKPGTEEITDYIELLKGDEEGDLMKNLAFTESGAKVVCFALAYGTAKDRKQILRTYKDTLQMMASDKSGHLVILTAYEVIDDTVLTAKSIFPELLSKDADKQVENVVFSANDLNARTTLLYLYQGRSGSLFPASHVGDIELLKKVDEIRSATSKKDPEIRRSELAKALSPHLLAAISAAPTELVATSFGCQFVTEVLFNAEGDKSVALEAIASTAGGDPTVVDEPAIQDEDAINTHEDVIPQSHVAQTAHGGKMLRSLIAGGRFNNKTKKIDLVEPALNFADILYPVIKEHIVSWATSSSSFVVLSLIESENFSKKDELKKTLKKAKKELTKAATEETAEQKKAKLVESSTPETTAAKKGKKTNVVREKEPGNMGSRLILKLLD